MFCLAIQPAAAGGLFSVEPAFDWRGAAVELLCVLDDALVEVRGTGAVVGWADEIETPDEELLDDEPKMVAIPEEGSVWPFTVAEEWCWNVMLMQSGCTVSGPMPCAADSVPSTACSEHSAADAELPVMSGSSL